VISRHVSNIFKSKELKVDQTVAKFATVQIEGTKKVRREIDYYNLDAIISVGYRVNSLQATQFRQWSTDVLKEHLTKGHTINKKRLAENGIKELQQSIELLQKTLKKNNLVNDIGTETIQLIINYTKTWNLLLAYDEDKLNLPKTGKPFITDLNYETALSAIEALKTDLATRNEATALFGNDSNNELQGIFMAEKKSLIGVRISSLPLSFEDNILTVPFYLIYKLDKLIQIALDNLV
jgi:hypothetical protein